jgi:hypothetical protein
MVDHQGYGTLKNNQFAHITLKSKGQFPSWIVRFNTYMLGAHDISDLALVWTNVNDIMNQGTEADGTPKPFIVSPISGSVTQQNKQSRIKALMLHMLARVIAFDILEPTRLSLTRAQSGLSIDKLCPVFVMNCLPNVLSARANSVSALVKAKQKRNETAKHFSDG